MTDIQKIIRLYKRRRDNKYLSDCYDKNYAIIGFGNHTIHNHLSSVTLAHLIAQDQTPKEHVVTLTHIHV